MLYNIYPISISQIKDINTRLNLWKRERRLTVPSQIPGLVKNIEEEVKEYYDAKTESDRFDALCDMAVFLFNSMKTIVFVDLSKEVNMNRGRWIKSKPDDFVKLYTNLTKEFPIMDGEKLNSVNATKLLALVFAYIDYLGGNIYIAMLETIKEISSRTGTYSEKEQKWIKDTSDEAKSKWYKANYELALYSYIKLPPVELKKKTNVKSTSNNTSEKSK